MLKWNLRVVFKVRGVQKPFSTLVKAGIASVSASSLLNNTVKRMRIDYLEKICRVLNCTPNDLLEWTPDSEHPLPENHELYKLHREHSATDLLGLLKSIPMEKLNEITNNLKAPGS
jgi:DNA-binding Xre family transcriptional regulator